MARGGAFAVLSTSLLRSLPRSTHAWDAQTTTDSFAYSTDGITPHAGGTRSPENSRQLPPARYSHLECMAAKCGHVLHPSISRSAYCSACVLSKAEAKFDAARKSLSFHGGEKPPTEERNQAWRNARLIYTMAMRGVDKARKKDRLRRVRERDWEELRKWAPVAYVSEGSGPKKNFSKYVSEQSASSAEHEAHLVVSDRNMTIAWWESPGIPAMDTDEILDLEHPIRSPEPKSLRGKTRTREKGKRPARENGSTMLRDLIRRSRSNFAMLKAEHKKWELNFRTEIAYRNKHNLPDDILFEQSCWETPFPGAFVRMCHQRDREAQLTREFKKRGHTIRPLPVRSSLWKMQSVDDFEVTKESRRSEEAERLERQARKAASEVGWLYYVGGGGRDLLEEWREVFLRSNNILVKGKWVLPPPLPQPCIDEMAESSIVCSIEPAESSGADEIVESADETQRSGYELLEQFLDTAMLDG